MTPPIYRARRKDNGEYVEGLLSHRPLSTTIVPLSSTSEFYKQNDGSFVCKINECYMVDPSTLAISFDGGYTWYDDVEYIKEALFLYCYHDKEEVKQ